MAASNDPAIPPPQPRKTHQTEETCQITHTSLDDLLESAVDGRPDVGDVLPEVDGGHCALGNALRGELKLL